MKTLKVKATTVFEKTNIALQDDKIRFIVHQGGSRCHAKDTLIRMYNGSLKNVQDIIIGDKIANYDGIGYSNVTNIYSGLSEMFKIKQNKGNDYITTGNHILCVKQTCLKYRKTYPTNERNPYGYGLKPTMVPIENDKNEILYITAEELSKLSGKKKKRLSGFKNTFLELDSKKLPIDPYYLGLWLGDGNSAFAGGISNIDLEITEYIKEISIIYNYKLSYDGRCSYRLRHNLFNKQTELSKEFYKLNLINNKHIPDIYIYNSYENRLKLLAGLMDSDGYNTGRNTYCIIQKNKLIIEGIKTILDISGFYTNGIKESIAKMKRGNGSVYSCKVYRIEFNHPNFNDLNSFIKVKRKLITKDTDGYMFNTKIDSEPIGIGEYYGFELDNKTPLYKLADGTITHNSSKTYSICQLLIIYCLDNPNKIVSIVRKTLPSLRGSVMRDLFEVMNLFGIYSQKNHNKTENLYKFDNGSIIEFFSADDEQKLRGRKRDILWVNEANDINFEEFTQLNIRTTTKLIFDFNPSDNFSWLYDLISRDDAILLKSTYKDNPFLAENQVKEIENLINYDISYYNIYCLGERGTGKTTIWTHWKYYDVKPETKTRIYGLDFGYKHAMALVECNFLDDSVYVTEKIYKEGLTTPDLIKEMEALNISKTDDIVCDSARPDMIEDLRRAGYKVSMAIKNVLEGIDSVKTIELFIDKKSLNAIKEISSYKWKTNGDIVLNEPVKLYDDLCFVGETLITTDKGLIQIKDIKPGDMVLTSIGYKKIINRFNNGLKTIKNYVIETDTFNIYVSCTPQHKIKTKEGWIQISQLQSGMTVFLDRNSMEKFINYTKEDIISHNMTTQCIEKCGNSTMVKYQKDSQFITLMETHGIIESKILNVYQQKNTNQNIQCQKNISKNSGKLVLKQQKNGIQVKKDMNGIKNMGLNVGLIKNMKQEYVNIVEMNMKQDIVVYQNSVETIVNKQHLEKDGKNLVNHYQVKKNQLDIIKFVNNVEKNSSQKVIKQNCVQTFVENFHIEKEVFDLEVEDIHEYFANGLLVHNCDAIRYSVHFYKIKNIKNKNHGKYIIM